MTKLYVIGAAGHVGLPFCVAAALNGYLDVVGIDLDKEKVDMINRTHKMPYMEEQGDLLGEVMGKNLLTFTSDFSMLHEADYIVIMIGTPVDEEGNANISPLLDLTEKVLIPLINNNDKPYVIMLRSTVSPGTTETIKKLIEKETRKKESKDFYLTFCPERVAQGKGIVEAKELPQLVGGFTDDATEKASTFFAHLFGCDEVLAMSAVEAELSKLITNMYRYVNFALANEFQIIARQYGADATQIIKNANYHYPRMNMPLPGPNVGGPCLYKDGKFLLENVSFTELIRASFHINEGMPDYILGEILKKDLAPRKILILGAAFKANNEDTRNSLSFKLRKICRKKGIAVDIIDPYASGKYVHREPPDKLSHYDAVVLMTPHDVYKSWLDEHNKQLSLNTIIVDLWQHWRPKNRRYYPEIYEMAFGVYNG